MLYYSLLCKLIPGVMNTEACITQCQFKQFCSVSRQSILDLRDFNSTHTHKKKSTPTLETEVVSEREALKKCCPGETPDLGTRLRLARMEPLTIGGLRLGKHSLKLPGAELLEVRCTDEASVTSVPSHPAPMELEV